MKKFVYALACLLVSASGAWAQKQQVKAGIVAFYNFENLFDTLDTENVRDTEFSPLGKKKWNTAKYRKKLSNLEQVISSIGKDDLGEAFGGPAVLGVAEIENRSVLEDVVAMPKLSKKNYKIVHYDSPDKRGIDVALLYDPSVFTVTNSRAVPFRMEGKDDFYTRDQLVVSGVFDGDPLHIIVNHWPSRRGGEKRSRPLRNAAADLTRSLADSILAADAGAKIIIMGDLNDDPVNTSVVEHLKAKGKVKNMKAGDFYNPFMKYYRNGIGTLAWNGSWNLFDQHILSPGLLNREQGGYFFYKAKIFRKGYLLNKEGRYKGAPFRTFGGSNFLGGYSDHLPTYLILVKK
ncbi:MAG: endonuclease/exonuclease/phosphatase family protein [Cytophagales bacterium]|nr:endonuclease/exonuclease/phosphatase family protein [Cytophagales bacterium]